MRVKEIELLGEGGIFRFVYILSGRVFSAKSKLKRGKTRPFSVLYPKHKNKSKPLDFTSRKPVFYLVTTKDPK